MVGRIRVVVGEDEYLLREALVRILASAERLEAVRFCGDADSLLEAVEEEEPDAVLTDIRMPPTFTDEGIRVAEVLRQTHPSIGVVILSQFVESDYALSLLEGGSARRAYLLKERVSDLEQVTAAVETVVDGGSVIDAKVVEVLVRARTISSESPLSALTSREREVLSEIAQGKSNAAIAASLYLTKRAVEKHINSIFLKLDLPGAGDVSRRVKATLLFLASGELPE